MINPPWTAVHHSPNRSARQPVARRGVVLHHAAMTSLDGLRRLAMGGKEVSATVICKDAQLELVVPDDDDRPWSLSSAWADSAFRSVETCNESTDGWTISAASHESLAHAVAYWAQTDGFWPHRDGNPDTWTVIGHREVSQIYDVSYSTACPGNLDLDLVTRRAQELLTATPTPAPKEYPLMASRTYYARIDDAGIDNGEWMIAGVDIPPHPTDPKQDGYRVTTDKAQAYLWARQYSFDPVATKAVRLTRDNYIAQQEFARRDAQEWRAGIRALVS